MFSRNFQTLPSAYLSKKSQLLLMQIQPPRYNILNQLLKLFYTLFRPNGIEMSAVSWEEFQQKIQQIQSMSKLDLTETNESKLPSLTHRNTNYNQTLSHRLNSLKKNKVRPVNQQIKANLDHEAPQRARLLSENINSSLQLPMGMMSREKVPTNHNATISNFLFDIFSPNKSPNNLHVRNRQKTVNSQKSNTTKNSKQVRKEKEAHAQNCIHLEVMKKLQQSLDENNLEKRLSMFSKESGKNSIRVYKEDIRKIIVQRYSKDRITTFLDTQYIEDFDSVLKTMKELTSLKREEMLVFCFLMIDQNKDGLITIEDLTNLLGIRSKNNDYNPLITQDVLKIHGYVEKMKSRGDPVLDECDRQILKDQCLTFMKFRINNFRQKKQQNSGESKKYFLSCRLHPHLYTLRNEDESLQIKFEERINIANVLLSLFGGAKPSNRSQSMIGSDKKFAINFNRFSQIFQNEVPKIFLDFLYLFGGMEVPGEQYLKVDNSILQEVRNEEKQQHYEEDKMVLTYRRLEKMSNFKKHLKIMKIKTEP